MQGIRCQSAVDKSNVCMDGFRQKMFCYGHWSKYPCGCVAIALPLCLSPDSKTTDYKENGSPRYFQEEK